MNALELSALLGAGAVLGGPNHRVSGALALPVVIGGVLLWGAWWRRQSVHADVLLARAYGEAAPVRT